MSHLRQNSNPGCGTERTPTTPARMLGTSPSSIVVSSSAAVVDIVVDPPSSDEADIEGELMGILGGGNDSDPPIENQNPEGMQFVPNIKDKSPPFLFSERRRIRKEVELVKKRIQQSSHQRKRRKSSHASDASYVPPYKKRYNNRRLPSVLPSKFLLGGNIRDPLNLASLADKRISAELNRITPQSSPFPVKEGDVPVYIPKNPHDPLGLTTRTPENVEDIVAGVGVRKNSCSKKQRHHRKRAGRKRGDSECSIGTGTEGEAGDTVDDTKKPKLSDSQQIVDKAKPTIKVAAQTEKLTTSEVGRGEEASEIYKKLLVESTRRVAAAGLVEARAQKQAEPPTGSESTSEKKKVDPTETVAQVPSKATTEEKSGVKVGGGSVEREGCDNSNSAQETYTYRSSSDYQPVYAPSPFAFDSTEYFLEPPPYESPFNHFAYTPTHNLQPFSPPAMPEIPYSADQRRVPISVQQMQRAISGRQKQQHHRHNLPLQRAVFYRPFTRKRPKNKADPIVSPVIPQPGRARPRGYFHPHNKKHPNNKSSDTTGHGPNVAGTSASTSAGSTGGKKYKEKDKVFQFGNYNQYYGYRTSDEGDPRLWALKKEYFEGKEVLDIGCNTGHVTLSIARDFEPRRIQGIDIDFALIEIARKNKKHYLIRDPENKEVVFPRSMPVMYGAMQPLPLSVPGNLTDTKPVCITGNKRGAEDGADVDSVFPNNVFFDHGNYVLPNDDQLRGVKPKYDVIVCFSVTKWVHLNFGDEGLKRFFKRIFLELRNDGIFLLEPQPWASYGKKKKITEKIHMTYNSIKFFPEQFKDFLLNDVGFATAESLGTPVHTSKGFQRPLLLFRKTTIKEASPASISPSLPSTYSVTDYVESVSSFCFMPPVTPPIGADSNVPIDEVNNDSQTEVIVSSTTNT